LNSLEDILKDPFYREEWPKNSAKIKRMVLEYWDAWYAVAPFAFTAHRDYAMFKNSGLIALNTCVPYIAQRLKKDYPTKADFCKGHRKARAIQRGELLGYREQVRHGRTPR